MPKDRLKTNRQLPARWREKHGAYYYRVPQGLEKFWDGKKEFQLGKTLPEAYRTWAARIQTPETRKTVNELFDRYLLEIVPTKAVQTQGYNKLYIQSLRSAFGHMAIIDIEPQHIYQYVDKRKKKYTNDEGLVRGGLSIAKREMAMFSDVFTKAVQWGDIKTHPFIGQVRLEGEKARTRYVEDWEILEFLSLKPSTKKDDVATIHNYTRFKLLTGMRQQDILRLRIADLKEDGIHVTPKKTEGSSGKSLIIEWSPSLRAVVDQARAERPVHISPFLFCTKKGQGYYDEALESASGWKSRWKRYMARVLKETKVTETFTEHDLRAKCGSDAETLAHAQQLLGHTDAKMTQKAYRRKAEKVKPLR